MATLPPLASPERAALNQILSPLATSNPQVLAALLDAASDAIRQECNRVFTAASYVEYHNGTPNQRVLRLNHPPVISVSRVAVATQAMQVLNSGTAYQRATVATTPTGVNLWWISDGISGSATLLYSAYPTINALAGAINALGNGWTTSIYSGSYGGFGRWPSSDLKSTQGALMALNGGAYLEIYEDWNAGTAGALGWGDDDGWGYGSGAGWRLDEGAGELHAARWARGAWVIRVDYAGGFAITPPSVEEGCVQHAKDLYVASNYDPSALSIRLGEYASDSNPNRPAISKTVRGLISNYVLYDKIIAR